jgi:hypothetical protein
MMCFAKYLATIDGNLLKCCSFCGCLDFVHIYDVARFRFLSQVTHRLPFVTLFCSSLEFHYHNLQSLYDRYGASNCSIDGAV